MLIHPQGDMLHLKPSPAGEGVFQRLRILKTDEEFCKFDKNRFFSVKTKNLVCKIQTRFFVIIFIQIIQNRKMLLLYPVIKPSLQRCESFES